MIVSRVYNLIMRNEVVIWFNYLRYLQIIILFVIIFYYYYVKLNKIHGLRNQIYIISRSNLEF